jgi:hypothetical protein
LRSCARTSSTRSRSRSRSCDFTALLDSEFPSSLEADVNALLDVPLNQQLNGGGAKTLVFTREAMESGPGTPGGAGGARFVVSNDVEPPRASPSPSAAAPAAGAVAASRQSLAATTGSIANGHHHHHPPPQHHHSLSTGNGVADDDEPASAAAAASSSSSRHKHRHKVARGEVLVKSCSMSDASSVASSHTVAKRPSLPSNGVKESLGAGSVPAPLNSNASAPAAMSKRSTSRLAEESGHLRTKSIK